jgi:septation ring formation regulator EzrA
MLSKNPRDLLVPLRVWIILEHAMIHKLHFGSATPAREALQTKTLIADITRIVRILDSDIAAEEQQARIFDRSQVDYPMLARTMATRRDNLLNTISALEQRLAKLDQAELVPELA